MNQQEAPISGTDLESVIAKLRAFVDGLTPEETEQVRALQTEDVTGVLAPSLLEKAQRAADTLTPEEEAHLYELLRESDTAGYMKAQYESDYGWKGPPGANPGETRALSGGLPSADQARILWLTAVIAKLPPTGPFPPSL